MITAAKAVGTCSRCKKSLPEVCEFCGTPFEIGTTIACEQSVEGHACAECGGINKNGGANKE